VNVALRIAFDMDGVLADMAGALRAHAEELYPRNEGESATGGSGADDDGAPAPPAAPPLTARQTEKLWRHVTAIENFWETLDEIEPGIVRRLAALAAERRWEIIFLTRRPESRGATSQVQTQRWLEAAGFPLPSVYVVQGSRGRIAAALALDAVVDDTIENCLDVAADSHARTILVWREDAAALPASIQPLGIAVAPSVAAVLDLLQSIDDRAAQPPSLVSRIKRALKRDESGAGS
jgi:hypothetical protein